MKDAEETKSLVDAMPDSVCLTDLDGNITEVNKIMADLFEIPKEKLLGRSALTLIRKKDVEKTTKAMRDLIQTGEPQQVEFIGDLGKTKGRPYWISMSLLRDHSGQPTGIVTVTRDITERKQVGEQLHLLSSVVQQSTEGMAACDLEGNLVSVNKAFAAMHGYAPEELDGKHLSIFHTPDQMPAVEKANQQILEMGEFTGEIWHVRRDGTLFPTWMHNSILRDNEGNPVGMIGTLRDITERKKAADALRESEERLTAFMESAPDSFSMYDSDLNLVQINKTGLDWFPPGTKKEDLIGKNMLEIAPYIKETGRYDKYVEVAKTGNSFFADDVVSHPGFGARHLVVRAFKMGDGLGITATDITERKHAEEERAKALSQATAAKQAQDMIEGMMDGVVLTDLAGTITDCNKALSRLMGFSKDKLKERHLDEFVAERDATRVRKSIKECIEKGFILDLECVVISTKKPEIPISVNASLLKDENGKSIGTIAVMRDITRRKKIEEELQNTNVQLSKTLTELKRTQQQVIQHERLSALGQMASGIAHDFNNALMPILGYTDLLLGNLEILDDRKGTVEMLDTVRSAAREASQAVRRLREFYRPSDEAERHPIDVSKLITDVMALTRPRWKEEMEAKGISIGVKTDIGDVTPVSGNESQLLEVLSNLIFNSVDAMPDGGTITIRSHTHRSGKGLVIQVIDTGKGMTEEVRRRCMEPFFTTKGGRGSGLGLPLAHGIVRRHNGSLEIQSIPGKETTVTIHLPFAEPSTEEGVPEVVVEAVEPLRILFVDDELSARDLVGRYLRMDKHTVELAEDGKKGLEKFHKGAFDLVIVDRAMPGMSGDQAAAAVKEANAKTLVILLTGFGDMMKDTGELPPSIDMIVTKPVSQGELRQAIAQVLVRNRRSP